jgi:hypothetical protein
MLVTGSLYKPLPLATIIKNYRCGMVTQVWQAEARNMKNYRHICPTDFKVRTLNYTAQLNNCMKIYYRYKGGRKMGLKILIRLHSLLYIYSTNFRDSSCIHRYKL